MLMLSAIFYYQANAMPESDALSKARSESKVAFSTLQRKGLNEQDIKDFKRSIQKLIVNLSTAMKKGDQSGRLDAQIGVQEDLILLVEKLVQYKSRPTKEDAEYLRKLAESNRTIAGFVKEVMDTQKEDRGGTRV